MHVCWMLISYESMNGVMNAIVTSTTLSTCLYTRSTDEIYFDGVDEDKNNWWNGRIVKGIQRCLVASWNVINWLARVTL